MSSLHAPNSGDEDKIWPWVKAYCSSCRQPYWFKNARTIDVALSRIDCTCGTKAFPKAIYSYELEDKDEP